MNHNALLKSYYELRAYWLSRFRDDMSLAAREQVQRIVGDIEEKIAELEREGKK